MKTSNRKNGAPSSCKFAHTYIIKTNECVYQIDFHFVTWQKNTEGMFDFPVFAGFLDFFEIFHFDGDFDCIISKQINVSTQYF